MTGRMAGKMALITGAAQGLGAAIATMYAKEGAKVVVTDITFAGAYATSAAITTLYPGPCTPFQQDVFAAPRWHDTVHPSHAAFGCLTVLVKNCRSGRLGCVAC